jgi:Adenylate and Guanylate cyclase catalytic domain
LWQTSPPPDQAIPINLNLIRTDEYVRAVNEATNSECGILSKVIDVQELFNLNTDSTLMSDSNSSIPHSIVVVPIYQNSSSIQDNQQTMVVPAAHAIALVSWIDFLNVSNTHDHPAILVVLTQCDGLSFSFRVDTQTVQYLGPIDVHESKFDQYVIAQQMDTIDKQTSKEHSLDIDLNNTENSNDNNINLCPYQVKIYPTDDFLNAYDTKRPLYFTIAVLVVFSFTSLMFLLYDALVQYRQSKLIAIATKTTTILSSLFPAQVRDQLFGFGRNSNSQRNNITKKSTNTNQADSSQNSNKSSRLGGTTRRRRRSLVDKKKKKNVNGTNSTTTGGGNGGGVGQGSGGTLGRRNSNNTSYMRESLAGGNSNDFDFDSKPIADLFPNATVLFADIAGFTAWSSVREPCQVFILLETIYRAFDNIAKKRRVFKVETIGDCYVAVVG